MKASVVVFGVGNPSRGDDAIGPCLIERLDIWLEQQGLTACFELIEDFQLQIEHALDLEERKLALFIDAGTGTPAPYLFKRIAPCETVAHTTHELAPEAVLQVYLQTQGEAPPPAFVLCVRGEAFELGEGLSPMAAANTRAAWEFLQALVGDAELDAWESLVG